MYFVMTPGEGRNPRAGSSALIRASIAWPLTFTSPWSNESFSPAATRICSRTMSIPVMSSVTGRSTCTRQFTSMK